MDRSVILVWAISKSSQPQGSWGLSLASMHHSFPIVLCASPSFLLNDCFPSPWLWGPDLPKLLVPTQEQTQKKNVLGKFWEVTCPEISRDLLDLRKMFFFLLEGDQDLSFTPDLSLHQWKGLVALLYTQGTSAMEQDSPWCLCRN